MKIFAYNNPDNNIRSQSSSGGLFTSLALEVLSEGGVIYGASYDENWNVRHIRVNNERDLHLLRGSKYVFSSFIPLLSDAISDLESGIKVLFSGTPCQIAAIAKRVYSTFNQNDHRISNILLVEIVCHGAPEPRYWSRYITEQSEHLGYSSSDIAEINFRDKHSGWKNYNFTIGFKDGKKLTQPHDKNPWMRAFLADLTVRRACFHCPFKYPNGSRADITIGDFWGINKLAPALDNNLGTTIAIARSQQGIEVMNNLVSTLKFTYPTAITELHSLKLEELIKCNPAIRFHPKFSAKRIQFDSKAEKTKDLISLMEETTRMTLSQSLFRKFGRLKKILCKGIKVISIK